MSQIKKMLVPTDFSPASEIAFDYAIDMAARQGSAIHLLHALDDMSFAASYPDGFFAELPGLRAQLIEEANTRLKALEAICADAKVAATSEVVVGRAARVIADVSRVCGADLIVMGTHGRSGFAHAVLGSVTERVIRTAPCAVLSVRETSHSADVAAEEALARRQTSAHGATSA